jgi:hypothetical protein
MDRRSKVLVLVQTWQHCDRKAVVCSACRHSSFVVGSTTSKVESVQVGRKFAIETQCWSKLLPQLFQVRRSTSAVNLHALTTIASTPDQALKPLNRTHDLSKWPSQQHKSAPSTAASSANSPSPPPPSPHARNTRNSPRHPPSNNASATQSSSPLRGKLRRKFNKLRSSHNTHRRNGHILR